MDDVQLVQKYVGHLSVIEVIKAVSLPELPFVF